MKTAKLVLFAAAFAAVAVTPQAKAQSCNAVLTDIANWFQTQPNGPGYYSVRFNMVTNRADGLYASYAEGPSGTPAEMYYHPAHTVFSLWYPPYMQGDTVQYFSDRRYPPPSDPFGFAIEPFNSALTDKTRATIELGSSLILPHPHFGDVTITLLSWGNASSTFTPVCQNGVMYGFVGKTIYTMSLNKQYTPIIP